MKGRSGINLDRVGAYASAICAVHCLITGIALGLLSVVGLGFLGSPAAELGFFLLTVTIGTTALVHGHRKHHSIVPALVFVCGLGCLLVSHFGFGHDHDGHGSNPPATFLNVVGGLSLVIFHVLNQRLQHRCGCDHCQSGE
ncbi:MAG: MerC domain-containing protein [Fimbriimonas sp.]